MKRITPLSILLILACACGSQAEDDAMTNPENDSDGPLAASTTRLRFAHMSVEQPPVILCVDGDTVEPLDRTPVAYPDVTAYLTVPADATVSVVPADGNCQTDPLLETMLNHGAEALSTLVMFGDPGSGQRPLELQALLDESDVAPPSAMQTRLRNFHTDTDVGNLDVGIEPAPETRIFLFEDVPYGGMAQGSSVDVVSDRGYVNIPSMPPADRLNIWEHGTQTLLGWFPTSEFSMAGGQTRTVFPAGRALTGTPEAVVCTDAVVDATPDRLWNACEVFVAQPPGA